MNQKLVLLGIQCINRYFSSTMPLDTQQDIIVQGQCPGLSSTINRMHCQAITIHNVIYCSWAWPRSSCKPSTWIYSSSFNIYSQIIHGLDFYYNLPNTYRKLPNKVLVVKYFLLLSYIQLHYCTKVFTVHYTYVQSTYRHSTFNTVLQICKVIERGKLTEY